MSTTQTSCFRVDVGSSTIIISNSIHFCIQNVLKFGPCQLLKIIIYNFLSMMMVYILGASKRWLEHRLPWVYINLILAVFKYTIQSHFSAVLNQVRHVNYSDLHDLSHTNTYSITSSGCYPSAARLLRHAS